MCCLKKSFNRLKTRIRLFCTAYPFWRWNTFWIVVACLGTNMLLAIPSSFLAAHPHLQWTVQQLIYVLALLYKFWTSAMPILPEKK